MLINFCPDKGIIRTLATKGTWQISQGRFKAAVALTANSQARYTQCSSQPLYCEMECFMQLTCFISESISLPISGKGEEFTTSPWSLQQVLRILIGQQWRWPGQRARHLRLHVFPLARGSL